MVTATDHAVVASATAGRVRIRVHRAHRADELISSVHAHLEKQAGVHAVDSNVATGSVVVKYNPEHHSLDDVLSMFNDVGVIVRDVMASGGDELPSMDGEGGESEHSKAALTLSGALDDLDRRVRGATGGHVDLKLLFPVTMGIIGVRQVMVNGLGMEMIPGYVLLWYAFDAFFKLHHQATTKAMAADRAGEKAGSRSKSASAATA
jgi:hypothetical protein